jgi:hypothetical protein
MQRTFGPVSWLLEFIIFPYSCSIQWVTRILLCNRSYFKCLFWIVDTDSVQLEACEPHAIT